MLLFTCTGSLTASRRYIMRALISPPISTSSSPASASFAPSIVGLPRFHVISRPAPHLALSLLAAATSSLLNCVCSPRRLLLPAASCDPSPFSLRPPPAAVATVHPLECLPDASPCQFAQKRAPVQLQLHRRRHAFAHVDPSSFARLRYDINIRGRFGTRLAPSVAARCRTDYAAILYFPRFKVATALVLPTHDARAVDVEEWALCASPAGNTTAPDAGDTPGVLCTIALSALKTLRNAGANPGRILPSKFPTWSRVPTSSHLDYTLPEPSALLLLPPA
ncbi:hypothetical protein C8J57DRAFT_1714373 [Mycena rebaudengoi]|nr:hypothetical protein C8J57DRAFT_1714373 [Mycena rebaudengoi]